MATQTLPLAIDGQARILQSRPQESCEFGLSRSRGPKAILLGLPCAHCKAYYAAEVGACPICGYTARESPARPQASMVMSTIGAARDPLERLDLDGLHGRLAPAADLRADSEGKRATQQYSR
jgi:hypothetical protein